MALLGDDGRGFELARKLESCGVWRSWLGDSLYSNFLQYLTSPATWESFMRSDDSKSRAQIQLQLRARALLFDKASVSLFLRSPSAPTSSLPVSKLNPSYLQLHGDDVYFTLEQQDGVHQREPVVASNTAPAKLQPKAAFGVGTRYAESEIDNISQRFRHEEFPETWYNLFMEKYKASRPYKLSHGERDMDKRTPGEMSVFIKLLEKHKRRRVAFKEDPHQGFGNPIMENESSMYLSSLLDGKNSVDDDVVFFPETMFTLNCVPESALLPITRVEHNQKVEFYGVLDTLPQVMTRSPIMIERLGIRPEYHSIEQAGSQYRNRNGSEGNRKLLCQEQALQMSEKVIAFMLTKMGFEGATEVPMEVLSQLLSCHICKLGRMLKVLSDNYRKQCSATELLKMFLQTTGHSNVVALVEHVKDGTSNFVQPTQQVPGIQPQLLPQHQSLLRQSQLITRQMHPQMQQIVHSQNLALQQQQQWERMRRRQTGTPRPGVDMDKDKSLVQVKLENPSELPLDSNAYTSINTRQLQFRQQQIAAMSNLQAQPSNQFRQLASLQIPQMPTQNMNMVRAPPVKVEGFQELMGGDATMKHDSEENKLTSPSKGQSNPSGRSRRTEGLVSVEAPSLRFIQLDLSWLSSYSAAMDDNQKYAFTLKCFSRDPSILLSRGLRLIEGSDKVAFLCYELEQVSEMEVAAAAEAEPNLDEASGERSMFQGVGG